MSKTKGFIFDYAKCVGCGACVVACFNENGAKPPIAWRNISTYNRQKVPLLGYVHLSLACNHCAEAPCMKACPSLAYSFHPTTGAVIHNPDACLGCRYCTWACPFGAPQYSKEEGIVEKCHFCYHRLEQGQFPACANNCPTGALGFGKIEEKAQPEAFGLSRRAIYPRISILNSEVINHTPEVDPSASGIEGGFTSKGNLQNAQQHNGIKEEWPLALFTFISSFLSGYIISFTVGNNFKFPVWLFAALAFSALLLSTLHLGKPFRSYLSIKNLKQSWLSREILLFGLFASTSFVAILVDVKWVYTISSVLSIMFLLSIEMVYSITKRRYITPIHSANTVLLALVFAAFFSQYWNVLIAILALKTILFIVNNGLKASKPTLINTIVGFTKIVFGFLLPFAMLSYSHSPSIIIIFISLIFSELIDRIIYYNDFEPERNFYNS
jgi:Fe-S-cluster-containing dehydrogenase component/DMSO reductase anchor subunit